MWPWSCSVVRTCYKWALIIFCGWCRLIARSFCLFVTLFLCSVSAVSFQERRQWSFLPLTKCACILTFVKFLNACLKISMLWQKSDVVSRMQLLVSQRLWTVVDVVLTFFNGWQSQNVWIWLFSCSIWACWNRCCQMSSMKNKKMLSQSTTQPHHEKWIVWQNGKTWARASSLQAMLQSRHKTNSRKMQCADAYHQTTLKMQPPFNSLRNNSNNLLQKSHSLLFMTF